MAEIRLFILPLIPFRPRKLSIVLLTYHVANHHRPCLLLPLYSFKRYHFEPYCYNQFHMIV